MIKLSLNHDGAKRGLNNKRGFSKRTLKVKAKNMGITFWSNTSKYHKLSLIGQRLRKEQSEMEMAMQIANDPKGTLIEDAFNILCRK